MATESDLRRVALALPGTTEEPWYGTPGYKVAGRGFLRLRSEAEGGWVVFVADLGEKQALLESDPRTFFTVPHYDGHACVLLRLPEVGLEELTELVTESWRLKAPVRLRQNFDAGPQQDAPL
jgi:hypothetical protein